MRHCGKMLHVLQRSRWARTALDRRLGFLQLLLPLLKQLLSLFRSLLTFSGILASLLDLQPSYSVPQQCCLQDVSFTFATLH